MSMWRLFFLTISLMLSFNIQSENRNFNMFPIIFYFCRILICQNTRELNWPFWQLSTDQSTVIDCDHWRSTQLTVFDCDRRWSTVIDSGLPWSMMVDHDRWWLVVWSVVWSVDRLMLSCWSGLLWNTTCFKIYSQSTSMLRLKESTWHLHAIGC